MVYGDLYEKLDYEIYINYCTLMLAVSCNTVFESDIPDKSLATANTTVEETERVDEVNSLLYIKEGNIKHLVGFEFGDEYDYNIF